MCRWFNVRGLCYTFYVKIYLDADGVSYREEVLACGRKYGVSVVVVADYSHNIPQEQGMERVTVDMAMDSADFAIANRVETGDLVITEDVGLASMVLPKGAAAISSRAIEFTEDSMERRLTVRWLGRKIRAAGGKTKGPRALSHDDRARFVALLERKMTELTGRTHES